MGWKIIFSPESIDDLKQIVGNIASSNSIAAEKFGLKLIRKTEILADFPELGSPYRRRVGVRKLTLKPYIIFYQLNERARTVEIMRLWHGARQNPDLR